MGAIFNDPFTIARSSRLQLAMLRLAVYCTLYIHTTCCGRDVQNVQRWGEL